MCIRFGRSQSNTPNRMQNHTIKQRLTKPLRLTSFEILQIISKKPQHMSIISLMKRIKASLLHCVVLLLPALHALLQAHRQEGEREENKKRRYRIWSIFHAEFAEVSILKIVSYYESGPFCQLFYPCSPVSQACLWWLEYKSKWAIYRDKKNNSSPSNDKGTDLEAASTQHRNAPRSGRKILDYTALQRTQNFHARVGRGARGRIDTQRRPRDRTSYARRVRGPSVNSFKAGCKHSFSSFH